MAACAAASTAATTSPMRSNSSDTAANSATSASRRDSANRDGEAARGPSTIPSSSRNRGLPDGARIGSRFVGRSLLPRIADGSSRFGRSHYDGYGLTDGALASGHTRRERGSAHSPGTEKDVPLVERVKRGGRLASRAQYSEGSREWDVITESPADVIARVGQSLLLPVEQRACGIEATRAECGPTRHRSTEQCAVPGRSAA